MGSLRPCLKSVVDLSDDDIDLIDQYTRARSSGPEATQPETVAAVDDAIAHVGRDRSEIIAALRDQHGIEYEPAQASGAGLPAGKPEPHRIDNRLRQEYYRKRLESLADQLSEGGGVHYLYDEHGKIEGRTPSANPEWFQRLMEGSQSRMTVREVKAAVKKANAGGKLGIRQQNVVMEMLDLISSQRENALPEARAQRDLARQNRARAAEDMPPMEAYDADAAAYDGQQHVEAEYDPSWDGETRSLFDLGAEAMRLDPDAAEAIMDSGRPDADVARDLFKLIEEKRDGEQVGAGVDEAAETPPRGDVADEARAGDEPDPILRDYDAEDLAAREQQDALAQQAEAEAQAAREAEHARENYGLEQQRAPRGEGVQTDMLGAKGLEQQQKKVAAEAKQDIEDVDGFQLNSFPGPVFDPKAWRKAIKAAGRMAGLSDDAMKKMVSRYAQDIRDFQDAVKSDRREGMIAPVKAAVDFARFIADSDLNRGRAIVRAMGKMGRPTETAQKLLDLFHDDTGSGRAVPDFYEAEINRFYTRWETRYIEAMNQLGALHANPESAAKVEQLRKLLENRGAIHGNTPLHNAAREIAGLFDESLTHMQEAGTPIKKTKNYFPHVTDTEAIIRDHDGFIRDATRAFMKQAVADGQSITRADAEAMAEAWYRGEVLSEMGIADSPFVDIGSAVPTAQMAKHRTFTDRGANEILQKWRVNDLRDLVPQYLRRAARRAAWDRRLGGTREVGGQVVSNAKWHDIQSKLIEEGNGDHVSDLAEIVRSITGSAPPHTNATARNIASWLQTATIVRFLNFAAFNQLVEPVYIAGRTGNASDIARVWKGTLQDLGAGMKKWLNEDWSIGADAQDMRDMAELVGVAQHELAHGSVLQHRLDGGLEGKAQQALLNRVTRTTFLHQFTEAQRRSSARVGQRFVRVLAERYSAGENWTHFWLRDLGISDAEMGAFARFVLGSDIKAKLQAGPKYGDMADRYATAIQRITDGTVVIRKRANQPALAKHPVGKVMYSLLSYIHEYSETIARRADRMLVRAWKNPDKLSAKERARLLAPWATLLAVPLLHYALLPVRDPARKSEKRQKEETGLDRALEAASRGGMFRRLDPWINMVSGMRFDRDVGGMFTSPYGAEGIRTAKDIALLPTGRNSENTATAEENVARDLYSLFIDPMITATASVYLPRPLAAPLIQVTNSPRAREAFGEVAGGALHDMTEEGTGNPFKAPRGDNPFKAGKGDNPFKR